MAQSTNSAKRSPATRDRRTTSSPLQIARKALRELSEITGREADTTSGLQRTDDGWVLQVEVVEVARIPDSTSVMATYEVQASDDGELLSYRRVRRYYRNQAGDS
jgi:hypothetical protein